MRLSILAALLIVLCPLVAATGPVGVAQAKDKKPAKGEGVKPPKRPANLEELGQRLNELAARIDKLLIEAAKDVDARAIDEYKNYSAKDLKKRSRVRARDLVVFMLDSKKDPELRRAAMKAIRNGGVTRSDPDLALEGSRTKRAQFCRAELLEHLRHENRRSRSLVDELLRLFWTTNKVRNPEISAFDKDKEPTWKPAWRAWKRYLLKK